MQHLILMIFLGLLCGGYISLIRRYIRFFTRSRKVRVEKSMDLRLILSYVFILLWMVTKLLRVYKTDDFLPWCIVAVLELIYTLHYAFCSRTVWFCEDCILFADCAKTADLYRYRITGETLELRPEDAPQRIESFRITGDEAELRGILQQYKAFE